MSSPVEFDPPSLILHLEVVIAAPPETIWPMLFRTPLWKLGGETRLCGEDDAVGRMVWSDTEAGRLYVRTISNLANGKAAFEVLSSDGAIRGYMLYSISGTAEASHLKYDVFFDLKGISGAIDWSRETFSTALSDRLNADLQRLKRLCEGCAAFPPGDG